MATTTETKPRIDVALAFELGGEAGRIPLTHDPRFRETSLEAACAAVAAALDLAHLRSLRPEEPGLAFRTEVAQNNLKRAIAAGERLCRYAGRE